MKTTLDLPPALVEEIKRRAEHKGQKLQEAVAELLRKGLAASSEPTNPQPRAVVKTHPRTGLPYIECRHGAAVGEEMVPERVAEILLEQELTWQHEAG